MDILFRDFLLRFLSDKLLISRLVIPSAGSTE